VWGNTAVNFPSIWLADIVDVLLTRYSNIEGGFAGTGNIDLDPLFSNPVSKDYRLLPCSPMINAGTPDTTGLDLPATDFYGQVRVMHDTVDIGAAEYNGPRNTIDLLSAQIEFCVDDAGINLNGTPAGGTYSGTGVAGSSFYPAFAGVGTHWVRYEVADSLACPNTDSILMTVHALPVVSQSDTSVCIDQPVLILTGGSPAGGTYSGAHLSGNVFNVQSAGVGTHTLSYSYTDPVTGCSNSVHFTVTVYPLPVVDFPDLSPACAGSGLISLSASPAGGTFSGPYVAGGSFDAAAAPVGSYTLYYDYTDPHGCSNTDSAVVTVHALPVASAGADVSVCQGSCTVLQASGGVTYRWSTGYTGTTWTVCPTASATYTVTVTSANGCTASDAVTVTVNPLPLANAGGDDTLCQGGTTSLSAVYAGAGASYSWSGALTGQSVNVSPLTTTTYTLTVTSANGCTATDQVKVVVLPVPAPSIAPVATVCAGECVVLTASGGASYLWSDAGATASATATVCPEVTTTYTVTVTGANGCTAPASVTVNVHPQVLADAGADQWICPGDCATLTATGGVSYLWSEATATASATVCPSVDTRYHVTVTSAQGCTAVDSVMVHLYTAPSFSLSGTDTIQPGDTATMSATAVSGQAPLSYAWSPVGTLLGNGTASVQAVPPASLWYGLQIADGHGCASTQAFLVTVAHPGASLAGRIRYANAGQTPIAGATVFLMDQVKSSPIIDSTLTDDRGYFWFHGLDTMDYTVYPALEGRWGWGGVNATDA
ncbi:MAG TPA: choice-of-anchor Q domain-containing protein, partial [Bacteroidales bacterium]|nr:choice-of-anchor Q domain-containing protein [Bacteroidales bacterium]